MAALAQVTILLATCSILADKIDVVEVHVLKGEPIRLEVLPHGSQDGMHKPASLLVKRRDMSDPWYVHRESDGHIDDSFQDRVYKNRTSLENGQTFIIWNATIKDSATYNIFVIPDEESQSNSMNRLKTPPSMIYRVLVTEQVPELEETKTPEKEDQKTKKMPSKIGARLTVLIMAVLALSIVFFKLLKNLCYQPPRRNGEYL